MKRTAGPGPQPLFRRRGLVASLCEAPSAGRAGRGQRAGGHRPVARGQPQHSLRATRLPRLGGPARPQPRPPGATSHQGRTAGLDDDSHCCGDLCGHCMQARATEEDGPESVRRAGLRPTYTPAVLITRGQLNVQLAKIINLPQDERVKSFRLLVALLGVADKRRRERFCADWCGHAWHQLAGGTVLGAATA
ncbi:DUF5958 family protein [Streptomyces sp. NBC_00424]|uniref:DUF5958 family protein n=1 Tax=Streptomyces sp. NBC_00424 TaxID=2903648 RepID=UPI002257BBD9|nr:DUF5958 family protein [Streptomyces sp. NBC_00424]MCX5079063.1 DUF5958 family protein [Streptomyces sp. NBC_00424]